MGPDRSRAVGTRALADSAVAAGIDVSRGQHAQQSCAPAGTCRTSTPANPCHCSCPLKPIMQRCVFLGLKFIHRTKPPQGETRPVTRAYVLHSLGPRGSHVPLSTPSWPHMCSANEPLNPTKLQGRPQTGVLPPHGRKNTRQPRSDSRSGFLGPSPPGQVPMSSDERKADFHRNLTWCAGPRDDQRADNFSKRLRIRPT